MTLLSNEEWVPFWADVDQRCYERWLLNYFAISLDCPVPVLHALRHRDCAILFQADVECRKQFLKHLYNQCQTFLAFGTKNKDGWKSQRVDETYTIWRFREAQLSFLCVKACALCFSFENEESVLQRYDLEYTEEGKFVLKFSFHGAQRQLLEVLSRARFAPAIEQLLQHCLNQTVALANNTNLPKPVEFTLTLDALGRLAQRIAENPWCDVCKKRSDLRCSRCKRAHYCSVECQRADWPQHKSICI